ncbi:MAG: Mfa1 fimbrilin C-terminal domain-containing protein [Muribaculaceae bacterium]|nr:Mfa1 fimbrilin C-terminal domain-containing protein [Muribaculaceae bacterium]
MKLSQHIRNLTSSIKQGKGNGTIPGVLCLLLILLSSCTLINEDFNNADNPSPTPSDSWQEYDLPGKLLVQLVPYEDSTTRNDPNQGFSDGDENEQEYKLAEPTNDEAYHYLLLYKNDGDKPVAYFKLSNEGIKDENTTNNLTLTISKIYSDFELAHETFSDLSAFQNWIQGLKGYVLLNFSKEAIWIPAISETKSDNYPNIDKNKTTEEILKSLTSVQLKTLQLKDYKITTKSGDYFIMSNSVYWNNDQVIDCNINKDNIVKSPNKPQKPAITIHVERTAVKYNVKFADNIIISGSDTELPRINPRSYAKVFDNTNGYLIIGAESYEIPYKEWGWEIDVVGYGANGLEPRTTVFKNISNHNTDLNGYKWNEPGTNRRYWADDIHYKISEENINYYPSQFRQSLEFTPSVRNLHVGDLTGEGAIDVNKRYSCYLNYKTYNDFEGKKGNLYSLENTYDDTDELLGPRGYFSAGTHLIVVGKIKLNNYNDGTDLYYDQNSIFYTNPSDLFTSKLEILNKIILRDGVHGMRVLDVNWLRDPNYNWDEELDDEELDKEGMKILSWDPGSILWVKVNNSTIRPAEPEDFRFIPAEIAGGDGSLLIAPNKHITQVYLAPTKDACTNTSEISCNDLISLIHKQIGSIDHFKDGMVYYAAPIPHFKETAGEVVSTTLGHTGCVRNQWYEITVNSMQGVGRPVDQADQPIIPTEEVKRSYLNLTVEIKQWHTISQDFNQSTTY